MLQPFVREAGSGPGPGVVFLHGNASSSSQWRGLIELLEATHPEVVNAEIARFLAEVDEAY